MSKDIGQSNQMYISRNHALGFASRTLRNLEYIDAAFNEGASVHVVTQLINSLLGLVVFLHERMFIEHIEKMQLSALVREGWPTIEIKKGKCETLGEFVHHLRNAVAHGLITFSSDSRNINDVTVMIEDRKGKGSLPHWCATVNACDLRTFCVRLGELVEHVIG